MKHIGILAVCFLIAAGALALPAWPEESPQRGQAEPPQNLQLLPPDVDIRMVMQNISTALGVQCSHCHTLGDFASDENPKKEIARTMMRMVRAINMDFLAGLDGQADCFLCHRGSAIPDPSQ